MSIGKSGPLANVDSEPLLNVAEAAPAKKVEQSDSQAATQIAFFCVLSVASSVFIAISMKSVMEHGFLFPLTISWIAYVFTYLFYVGMKAGKVWSPDKDEAGNDKYLPAIENIKVAVASIGSISFMNLCLKVNTVSIYQICKFATIPTTLVLQYFVWGRKTNWRILVSLSLLLGGVIYSSMKSFDAGKMSPLGIGFAIIAVGSTSVYRIFQETKQKEFKIGPETFQASMSGWQAVLGFVAAFIVEGLPIENDAQHTVIDWLMHPRQYTPELGIMLLWLFGVCCAALLVNYTSMVLIGKTGPVAYAVVGNAKTVLTICMGLFMFPGDETAASIRGDIIGCAVGIIGGLFYAYFEYCWKKNVPDFVEAAMPCLVGKKAEDWKAEKVAAQSKA